MLHTKTAIVTHVGAHPIEVETLKLEPPHKNEVLVRMQAAGVCRSDWHVVNGSTKHPLPAAIGHEGSGVVEAIGVGVVNVKVGDHIALSWAPYCGSCFHCVRYGLGAKWTTPQGIILRFQLIIFPRLTRADGSPALGCFSEYVVVPDKCCIPLPSSIPAEVRALIGCAVTTGVGAVLHTAFVTPGSTVAVFGGGGVGLSVVMGSVLAGAVTIILIDKAPEKKDIGKSFGATHFVNASKSDEEITKEVLRITDNIGVDYAFEAVGVPALQQLCVDVVRPGGTAVLVGLAAMGTSFPLSGATLTRKHKTVKGCYYGGIVPNRDFPEIATLYLSGKLPLDKLVTKRYTLDQINEAYDDMLKGRAARGVIVFDQKNRKSDKLVAKL